MRLYNQNVLIPDTNDVSVATERLTFMNYTLYNKLVEIFTNIKSLSIINSDTVARTGIKETVKEHVGINLEQVIILNDPDGHANMAALTPIFDQNNVLIKHEIGNMKIDPDAKFSSEIIFKDGGVGIIDRKTMKVGGVYSKHPVKILISDGFIKKIPAETLAAVFIHEVGHLFTSYERVLDMAYINFGIAMAIDRIYSIEDKEQRVSYVNDWSKANGIKLDANEIRLDESNKKATFIRIMCDVARERRDEFGNLAYSARSAEYLADQFVMFHGGASAFKHALSIPRTSSSDNVCRMITMSWAVAIQLIIPTAIAVFSGLWTALVIPAMTLILSAINDPYTKKYDDNRQRMARILNGINNMLKDRNLSKSSREALLNEAALVKDVIDNSNDHKSFYEYIHRYILRKDASIAKSIEFQERLERLSNNNLFQLAARLQ